jgi:hypothetical protein
MPGVRANSPLSMLTLSTNQHRLTKEKVAKRKFYNNYNY